MVRKENTGTSRYKARSHDDYPRGPKGPGTDRSYSYDMLDTPSGSKMRSPKGSKKKSINKTSWQKSTIKPSTKHRGRHDVRRSSSSHSSRL